MVEVVDNAIQLIVLVACFAASVTWAVRKRDRMWVTISFFFGCSFFSTAYWTGYLIAFGQSPRFAFGPYLGWVAAYIFLMILLVELDSRHPVVPVVRVAWAVPVACVPACVLFCQYGNILFNLVDCALIGAIGYFSARGLAVSSLRGFASGWALHAAILCYAVVELALWTASCFWGAETLSPYVVADLAFTASNAAILVCAWKMCAR